MGTFVYIYYLYARYCTKLFTFIISFNPYSISQSCSLITPIL